MTAPLGALLAILALVLGGIGITKARRTNASGIGMAIGGIVAGLIGLVAASVWLALWTTVNGAAEETGGLAGQIRAQAARSVAVADLSVGDCYDDVPDGSVVHSVSLVDCDRPHPTTWAEGDREVVCVIWDPAGPVTGTMRNSGKQIQVFPLSASAQVETRSSRNRTGSDNGSLRQR